MFEILPVNDKAILAFKASGKLTDADYKQFLPQLEGMIRDTSSLSLYVELEDFKGWEPRAAWDDLKFGLHYDRHLKRIAIMGDKPLEHAIIDFVNFFSHSELRFFSREETDEAWDWLREKPEPREKLAPAKSYKNILLPIDFSVHSEVAANRAQQLAEQYGANLHVLNVIYPVSYYTDDYDPVVAVIPVPEDTLVDQAINNMDKFIQRTHLQKNVEHEIQLGNPKTSIVSWANEKHIDLIVMGSHGLHGIERLLGSVSNSVLHKANCDVLIVKE
ncbi:hypothetical protein MNBD_GAMMA09-3655 [hydrothermal vent metagenome]|uniref:UspA domain-containing protein n=1 Tax=hydrothermal vent metagenome TaxID=652676 RepID=A0A3B0XJE8_9ZZZZ